MAESPDGRTTRELRLESAGGEGSGRETRSFRAVEAWRGETDHGLCYFLALGEDDGDPSARGSADDREDRRAVMSPDERLEGLDEERLRMLFERGKPLTVTERRFATPDGRLWLAQNTGPVWAETGVAEGATGILFTSLDGPFDRSWTAGGHVAELDMKGLLAARERAFAPAEEPEGAEAP